MFLNPHLMFPEPKKFLNGSISEICLNDICLFETATGSVCFFFLCKLAERCTKAIKSHQLSKRLGSMKLVTQLVAEVGGKNIGKKTSNTRFTWNSMLLGIHEHFNVTKFHINSPNYLLSMAGWSPFGGGWAAKSANLLPSSFEKQKHGFNMGWSFAQESVSNIFGVKKQSSLSSVDVCSKHSCSAKLCYSFQ